MDYGQLFFNAKGRIGPGEFQQGALILIGISFVLAVLPLLSPALGLLGIIGLILIWPWASLWSKRLHDAGVSGWMFILVLVGWLVVGMIVSGVIGAMFAGDVAAELADVDQTDFAAIMQASMEAQRGAVLPQAIAGAVVSFLVVFIGNAMLKGDPQTNQYGPPPGSADGGDAPAA
jgi:uncharacterized membrane protein YhaH (DUF805 family)